MRQGRVLGSSRAWATVGTLAAMSPGLARTSALAALLLLAATSCHHGGSARFEGRWKGVRAEGVGGDATVPANAFATGTQLEVKGDTITVSTPKDKQTGHYKVVKEDKVTLVITCDRDGDEQQKFTFVDDKTLKWAVQDGKSIVFARQ
jgi:hypothetical protein